MATVGSAPQVALLAQLGLSIVATVAASMILAGARYEVARFREDVVSSAPDLTSGGKFAARVQALRGSSDDPAIVAPSVPVLLADAAFRSLPVSFSPDRPANARASVDVNKGAKRTTHADVRHRVVAEEILPPKRSDNVAASATPGLPAAVEVAAGRDGSGLWPTAKGLYNQALGLGGTVLDRVNPLNLIP